MLTREQLLAEVWGWPGASGHPHGRQPREGAARQDRRRPGPHRARRRLRPRAGRRGVTGQPLDPGPLGQGQARAARRGQRHGRLGRRRRSARAGGVPLWLSIPVTVAAGARRHPAARRRHDLAAARDDRGRPADGARRLLRPGHRDLAATRSASWPGPSTGWPRTWPRSTGSAASWSPTSATSCAPRCRALRRAREPRRRRRRARTRARCARRSTRPSGWRPWSPTCSTSPGSTPARRRCPASRSRSRRCSSAPSPRRGSVGRDVAYDVRVDAARPRRPGRPGPAAPAGRQPARQRLAAQPAGGVGPGDRGPASATGWRLEVADEGPGVAAADRERAFERFGTLSDDRGRRRHRPRPRHRPLGHRPARRHHRLRRPRARQHRRPGPGRPARRAAQPAHARRGAARCPSRRPGRPPAAAPPCPPARAGHRRRCSAASGPTRGVPGNVRRPARRARRRACWPAIVLPFRDLGLGTFLVLLAAGGVVLGCQRAHRRTPFTLACAALCVLLAATVVRPGRRLDRRAVPARRRGASACAGLARGRTLPALRAGRASPGRSPGCAACPGSAARCARVTGLGQRRGAAAHRRLVGCSGVLVFGLLFASADALFAEWVGALVPDLELDVVRAAGVRRRSPSAASCWRRRTSPSTRRGSSRPSGPARPVAHRFEWLAPVLRRRRGVRGVPGRAGRR